MIQLMKYTHTRTLGFFFAWLSALFVLALCQPVLAQNNKAAACPAVLQHTVERLQDEKPQNLCQYAGKVVADSRNSLGRIAVALLVPLKAAVANW